ncbi:MAG: hypothetical protein PHR20_02235 [Bacteroidales bacterium]|nr:hypothetical protein [Bacteroidales bacterium]
MRQLLACVLAPLSRLYAEFGTYRTHKLYRIAHNGQVVLLEKAINEYYFAIYDMEDPTIYIEDPTTISEVLIPYDGEISEFQTLITYDGNNLLASIVTLLTYSSEDTSINLFEVHLPVDFGPDNNATLSAPAILYNNAGGLPSLISLLETYKLAGKRYNIIYDN